MSAAIMVAVTDPCEPTPRASASDPADEVSAWAASGAMWLTGPPDGDPLGPPAGLVPRLRAIGEVLRDRAAALGASVAVDPLVLLGRRAAVSGLRRQGTTSCGGATRLLPAADGWVAVSLARSSDVELVPAWLELDAAPGPVDAVWPVVASRVAGAPAAALVDRAALLGLPVAALPATISPPRPSSGCLPVRATAVDGAAPALPPDTLDGLLVADLSSLWAGPLAASLLAAAGATVVKVESTARPDGARRGPPAFFDLLNAGKRSVALDLRTDGGVRLLREVLTRADVVVEASRPRALEQLGIDAHALLAGARPRVWVSITGHGRGGPGRERVGFGDDAAVAGGLVCWSDGRPHFCADAVADPTSGLVAAAAALDALAAGGRWLVDVAMSDVAAHLAGPTLPGGDPPARAERPRFDPPPDLGPAAPLGAHTRSVLTEMGLA
jgi:hypothetical protein